MRSDFIYKSLSKGLSFFALRNPRSADSDAATLHYGAAMTPRHGIHGGCFLISAFTPEICGELSIEPQIDEAQLDELPDVDAILPSPSCFLFPPDSTDKNFYLGKIKGIIDYHKINGGKTVYSRVIVKEFPLTKIDSYFRLLCSAYPDAAVFAFSTPQSGLWIGASPELLLSRNGEKITTMALAGTRPSGEIGEWDYKNKEEQQLVADFITDSFLEFGIHLPAKLPQPKVRKAGPVEHLCTDICGVAPARLDLRRFLTRLSPTPALCGSDRATSLRILSSAESHSRGFYGGYFGFVSSSERFNLYVNLRSMCLASGLSESNEFGPTAKAAIYVGGGITGLSQAESEWEETERKSATTVSLIRRLEEV